MAYVRVFRVLRANSGGWVGGTWLSRAQLRRAHEADLIGSGVARRIKDVFQLADRGLAAIRIRGDVKRAAARARRRG
jgi:hypothetical protein